MLALKAGKPKVVTTPRIIAEGVIKEITISSRDADMIQLMVMNPEQPGNEVVKLVFSGPHGFYLMIFDHRKKSIEAFRKGLDAFRRVFQRGGCLGRFARKSGQYVALADVDDPLTDIDSSLKGIVLTRRTLLNKGEYLVIDGAIHDDTRICFVVERMPPPA